MRTRRQHFLHQNTRQNEIRAPAQAQEEERTLPIGEIRGAWERMAFWDTEDAVPRQGAQPGQTCSSQARLCLLHA